MTSEVNAELLCAVLTFLVAHPEKHDQNHWLRRRDAACETVGCVAGWTCLLNGYEPRYDALLDEPYSDGGTELNWVGRAGHPEERLDVSRTAAALLDLDSIEADDLFNGDHTIYSLWEAVENLTEGRVRRP